MISLKLKSLYGQNYQKYIKEGESYLVAFTRYDGPCNEINEDQWNAYRIKYPKRAKPMVTWFKIKITYLRSGVAFYALEEFPQCNEQYFLVGSLFAEALIPCNINLDILEKDLGIPKEEFEIIEL